MKTKGRGPILLLRAGPGQRPGDVVSEMSHQAWGFLTAMPAFKAMDPHRWRSVFLVFQGVFKGRLAHYKGCGELEECRASLKEAAGGRPIPSDEWGGLSPVYALETGRDMERLSRLLAGLACRRLNPFPASVVRKEVARGLAAVLLEFLGGRVYQGAACATCKVLEGQRERRLWQEDEGAWALRSFP